MASTIRVDNVQNTPGTNIINKCSVTTTVGAGAGETINVCAATVNLGRSGGTVNLTCGASQTGFGRSGAVNWDTSIHTSTVTAESGKGYFVNTTGGAVTVNLPAASVGDIVAIKDYAGTFDTYACTIAPNGSDNIGGDNATDPTLTAQGGSVTLVYADATQGWLSTQENVTESPSGTDNFIVATGGNQPTAGGCIVCTNYKVHTFTGPGTFCVSQVATTAGNNAVAYMVVAGGGGGAGSPNTNSGSAGGAGGFREGTTSPIVPYTASPIVAATGITVSVQGYPISVGGGGAGSATSIGTQGGPSEFDSIISAGGGRGATGASPGCVPNRTGGDGGSGGGGAGGRTCNLAGAGDVPDVEPDQGFPGGSSRTTPGPDSGSGGGGGATAIGGQAAPGGTPCSNGGTGGAGAGTAINPSPSYGTPGPSAPLRYFAGGGGGVGLPGAAGPGGVGGGGAGKGCSPASCSEAGGCNTGGGGGGGWSSSTARAGGSGIVIIRYKFQ